MWTLGIVLIRWAFVASALSLAAALVPDVEVHGGLWGLFWVAAVFGLVNAVLGPLLRLLALPLTLVTFGLFGLVVNGVLLAITAGLTDALAVGGFLQTILASLIITLVGACAQFMLYGRVPRPA